MTSSRKWWRAAAAPLALGLGLATSGWGQTTASSTPVVTPAEATPERLIQVLQAETGVRFRYVDAGPGRVVDRDIQYKFLSRVQFNFSEDGSTYFQMRAETGSGFVADFNNSGLIRGPHVSEVNVKSMLLGHKFGRRVEAQVGGLEFDSGAGSQATYADSDGWFEGYRARFNGPGRGWQPDKLSVTWGYVGDFTKPTVFARLHRLGEANYVQVMAQKLLDGRINSSAEFDSIAGIPYFRAALARKQLALPFADDALVETIVRTAQGPSLGWSASLNKKLDGGSRWRAGLTYSDMPSDLFNQAGKQVLLNGDAVLLGQRLGASLRYSPLRNVELSCFGSRRLDETPGHRYRGQFMVKYQLAGLLNQMLR